MGYNALLELACFDHLEIERRKTVLFGITEALALADLQWLIQFPGTPRLYQVAPRYDLKVRPLQIDGWSDILTVYTRKAGDCKDFVAIRLAELRKDGNIQAVPYVTHQVMRDPATGQQIVAYHVQLACGGKLEDPAGLLGMPRNITFEALKRVFV